MFPKISLYFAYLGTNCSKQSKLQTMKQRVKLEQEKAFKAHNPVPIKKKVHALIILQFLLFWDGKSQPKYIMIFHFRFTRSYRIRILKHNYRIHVIVSLRLRQIWFMFRCSLVKSLKRAFYQLRGSLPFWWAIACSFQLKSSFYKLKLSNWVFCLWCFISCLVGYHFSRCDFSYSLRKDSLLLSVQYYFLYCLHRVSLSNVVTK